MRILGTILAVSLLTAATNAASMSAEHPSDALHASSIEPVVIAPSTVDLGAVVIDHAAEGALTLVNPSNHDVLIESIKPRCGCTAIPLPKERVLSAGATMTLPFTITAPKQPRLKKAGVTVLFANHQPIEVDLVLDAVKPEVIEAAEVHDAPLNIVAPDFRMSEADADGRMSGTVFIVNTSSEPIVLDRIRPSCGCTTVSLTKALEIAPGGAEVLSVAIRRPTEKELARAVEQGRQSLRKVIRCTIDDGRMVDLAMSVDISPDA